VEGLFFSSRAAITRRPPAGYPQHLPAGYRQHPPATNSTRAPVIYTREVLR